MKKYTVFFALLLFSIVIFGQETQKNDQNLSAHYPLPKVDKRVDGVALESVSMFEIKI